MAGGSRHGPQALLACPPELHDTALTVFGIVLHSNGWRIGYLGASIPVEELERAAGSSRPDSDGFVPGIFARHGHLIDEIVAVDSSAAISEMRRLARQFGLFVGPSSGAHLLAALELRARYPDLRHVVTFFCDEGEKYINDYFLGTGSGG